MVENPQFHLRDVFWQHQNYMEIFDGDKLELLGYYTMLLSDDLSHFNT